MLGILEIPFNKDNNKTVFKYKNKLFLYCGRKNFFRSKIDFVTFNKHNSIIINSSDFDKVKLSNAERKRLLNIYSFKMKSKIDKYDVQDFI